MLRIIILLGIFVAFAQATFAQGLTPSQLAIQIDNNVNQMAQILESQQKKITDLQDEITDLKTKCGDACKPKDETTTDKK